MGEDTYTTGAGLEFDEGFMEYSYMLLAITIAVGLVSFLWFNFRAAIVAFVEDKVTLPITYTVSELSAKLLKGEESEADAFAKLQAQDAAKAAKVSSPKVKSGKTPMKSTPKARSKTPT